MVTTHIGDWRKGHDVIQNYDVLLVDDVDLTYIHLQSSSLPSFLKKKKSAFVNTTAFLAVFCSLQHLIRQYKYSSTPCDIPVTDVGKFQFNKSVESTSHFSRP